MHAHNKSLEASSVSQWWLAKLLYWKQENGDLGLEKNPSAVTCDSDPLAQWKLERIQLSGRAVLILMKYHFVEWIF